MVVYDNDDDDDDDERRNRINLLKGHRKRLIQSIIFFDTLMCVFCFGLYGVPLEGFTHHQIPSNTSNIPNYNRLTSLYPLYTEDDYKQCCNSGFYSKITSYDVATVNQKWYPLLANPSLSSIDSVQLEDIINQDYTVTTFSDVKNGLTELLEVFHILSYMDKSGNTNLISTTTTTTTTVDNDTDTFTVKLPLDLLELSPQGFTIKEFTTTNVSDHDSREDVIMDKNEYMCCVCYNSRVNHSWSGDFFLVYGLLLLLNILILTVIVKRNNEVISSKQQQQQQRSSLATTTVNDNEELERILYYCVTLSLLLPCISNFYMCGMYERDYYNLLSPARPLVGQVSQHCVTIYKHTEIYYPAYYLVMIYSGLKLTLFYIVHLLRLMIVRTEKKKNKKMMMMLKDL